MLSYQHAYHAGNLADVHKHGVLAWVIDYLTRKDKPLTYIETHAGRGVYDLTSNEALKTGEAAAGILRSEVAGWFDADHPYGAALTRFRDRWGENAYPGSPMVAASLLRDTDVMHLAELHPQENAALKAAMGRRAHIHQQDGYKMAKAICPPTPRRGLLLIDPSFEQKAEYDQVPDAMAMIHKKWNVGVIMLWYPVLQKRLHGAMAVRLESLFPDGLRHEVAFPPAREDHGMTGSGLFIINPPYGLREELDRIGARMATLTG
ncbi:23S rRNA (adenine(2030)-N(6))-methyltransferase RlmJ [Hwanghaeella sp.]|uniref:23S rRNA (adenine(2030)-N(6))-methyltransferase RlmJ n=1 Tax=Hwanghaeella sp. TaxID=2605943 RepID=UPI003CCBE5FC